MDASDDLPQKACSVPPNSISRDIAGHRPDMVGWLSSALEDVAPTRANPDRHQRRSLLSQKVFVIWFTWFTITINTCYFLPVKNYERNVFVDDLHRTLTSSKAFHKENLKASKGGVHGCLCGCFNCCCFHYFVVLLVSVLLTVYWLFIRIQGSFTRNPITVKRHAHLSPSPELASLC